MMTMWGWKLAFENFDQVWEVTNLIFLVELNSRISEKKPHKSRSEQLIGVKMVMNKLPNPSSQKGSAQL